MRKKGSQNPYIKCIKLGRGDVSGRLQKEAERNNNLCQRLMAPERHQDHWNLLTA